MMNSDNLDKNKSKVLISFSEVKLLEVLGRGSFGVVHRGIWQEKEVAVKITNLEHIRNFEKEVRLLSDLNHENIITILGACHESPNQCLLLEYAKGGTLTSYLSKYFLSFETLIDWAIQIIKGMLYLHQNSIIHRDLKSSNILLMNPVEENVSNVLKISDFGSSCKLAGSQTKKGEYGTVLWLSPESIIENSFSKQSDVWSFGVVFWELLTGELPYRGMEMANVIYQIGRKNLTLPIPNSCPPNVSQILTACWQVEWRNRPLFEEILEKMQEINLYNNNFYSFKMLQHAWKNEIEMKLMNLNKINMELEKKEMDLRKEAEIQKLNQDYCNMKISQLQFREQEIFIREISVAMMKCIPYKGNETSKPKIKKDKKLTISEPRGFQHLISVRRPKDPKEFNRISKSMNDLSLGNEISFELKKMQTNMKGATFDVPHAKKKSFVENLKIFFKIKPSQKNLNTSVFHLNMDCENSKINQKTTKRPKLQMKKEIISYNRESLYPPSILPKKSCLDLKEFPYEIRSPQVI